MGCGTSNEPDNAEAPGAIKDNKMRRGSVQGGEGTTSASEDIHKVYRFDPKVIGTILSAHKNVVRTWSFWNGAYWISAD